MVVKFSVESVRGVYHLVKKKEVVYVGKTDNIYSRISIHMNSFFGKFDEVEFYPVGDEVSDSELSLLEFKEYVKYKPKYNKQPPVNNKFKSEEFVRDAFQIKGIVNVRKIASELDVNRQVGLIDTDDFLVKFNEYCKTHEVRYLDNDYAKKKGYEVFHDNGFIKVVVKK